MSGKQDSEEKRPSFSRGDDSYEEKRVEKGINMKRRWKYRVHDQGVSSEGVVGV